MQDASPRSAFWWVVTWLLQFAMLPAAFLVWMAFQRSNWAWMGVGTALAVCAFCLHRVTRRQALGWIIDENGERQKVTSWSRGHAISAPTTHSSRMIEEAQLRDERRKKLLWMGVLTAVCGAAGWYAWPEIGRPDGTAMIFVLACLFGSFAVVGWLANFLNELLYLSGWQDMRGAKVLDREPSRPGLDEVAQQKTHGAGRVASEEEALAILNQGA